MRIVTPDQNFETLPNREFSLGISDLVYTLKHDAVSPCFCDILAINGQRVIGDPVSLFGPGDGEELHRGVLKIGESVWCSDRLPDNKLLLGVLLGFEQRQVRLSA